MRIQKLSTETIVASTLFFLLSTLAQADIVFKSLRNDASELYVMNDDGSQLRRLTDNGFKEGRPIWSPDGRYIVFMRDINSAVPGQPQQIHNFVMHADGSHPQNLTQPLGISGGNATWSPDGQSLLISIWRNKTHDIATLDIANSTLGYLTNNPAKRGGSTAPSWSPNGRHIVYEQTQIAHGRTIYKMDANGKHSTELLPGDGKTMRNFPRWSPDGKYILYSETEFHIGQGVMGRAADRIVIMRADGSNPRALSIPKTWATGAASWAADGTQIIFSAMENGLENPNGNFEIYRYDRASRGITNLTNHPAHDFSPDSTPRSFSVSPKGKLTTQWAKIKAEK